MNMTKPHTSSDATEAKQLPDDLINAEDLLSQEMSDPEFREHWERTAVARAVALWLVRYRGEHGLSQRKLAQSLNVSQPLIARLETGGHAPDLATLLWLADTLGISIHLDITASGSATSAELDRIVEQIKTDQGSQLQVSLT